MNRSPMYHELKIWPIYFNEVITGRKTFEYRFDDRGYLAGDHLILREWDPGTKKYSRRYIDCYVPYVLDVGGNFVVMSIWRESDVKYENDKGEILSEISARYICVGPL